MARLPLNTYSLPVYGVMTLLLPLIKAQYPLDIIEISNQSENAPCLASHYIIAYIHHLNKRGLEGLGLTLVQWIYTEAGLDTHFSFVNTVFQSHVESGNDIRTEQQIYDALYRRGGLIGSTLQLFFLTEQDQVLEPPSP
jgi:hypothetical protein